MDSLRMPDAVLQRVVKAKLPENVHLAKDARLALHEAAVVFVSYLTTAALDLCNAKNAKTLNVQAVVQALRELELDDLVPEVEATIDAMKQAKRKSKAEKGKEKDKDGDDEEEEAVDEEAANTVEDDDAEIEASAPLVDAPEEQ